jgi:DNA N-6-adenine-methyltransferase (Dam)
VTSPGYLSSEDMSWQTPEWFLDLVRLVGPIDFDPCTVGTNPTKARDILVQTPESCGLSLPWQRDGLAFVNPPYGAHLSGDVDPGYEIKRKGVVVGRGRGWARKIAQDGGEWLALVPVRTETDWWRELFQAADETLLWSSPVHGSRIRFIDPATGKEGPQPNAASTVFYCGPNRWRFRTAFWPHGTPITMVNSDGSPRVPADTVEQARGRGDVCHECEEPIENPDGADGLICKQCVEERDKPRFP